MNVSVHRNMPQILNELGIYKSGGEVGIVYCCFLLCVGPQNHFFRKIDFYLRFILASKVFDASPPFAIPLSEVHADSPDLVGGKAFNLGAIKRDLQYRLPDGFVVTTHAYHHIIESGNLRQPIEDRLAKLDVNSVASLDKISREISEMVLAAPIPSEVAAEISAALQPFNPCGTDKPRFAIRSSAVAEDSQTSFAGQY